MLQEKARAIAEGIQKAILDSTGEEATEADQDRETQRRIKLRFNREINEVDPEHQRTPLMELLVRAPHELDVHDLAWIKILSESNLLNKTIRYRQRTYMHYAAKGGHEGVVRALGRIDELVISVLGGIPQKHIQSLP